MSLFNPFSGGGGFSLPGFGGGGLPGLPQIPGLPAFPGMGGQPQQPNYGGGGSFGGPYQPMAATSTGSPDFQGLLSMLMNQNRQGVGGGQSYLGGQGLI